MCVDMGLHVGGRAGERDSETTHTEATAAAINNSA